MSIVIVDEPKSIGKYEDAEGRKICKENDFMNTIMKISENEEFKKLLSEYCTTGTDTKTVFMYLKIYNYIDEKYGKTISPYQKISIVSKLIKNRESRHEITTKTQQFLM
jgi:hypothetical protein